MKFRFLFPIIFIFLFSSCTPKYYQLYKTQSVNIPNNERSYKFENDSIEINYSFWADKGIMSFSVFNKTSKPIYIDWKKSNFISNTNKFNYWDDETKTKGIAASFGQNRGYFYKGPLLIPYLSIYESASASLTSISSTTIKPERISFIPPKSITYKSPYFLTNSNYPDKNNFESRKESRFDNPKKKTTIFYKTFTKENSPLIFRNFLTFSFSEDFKDEFYVDNEFFVNEVDMIDKRHFERLIIEKSKTKIVYRFQKGIDFYRN
jgi:hypothetical protein